MIGSERDITAKERSRLEAMIIEWHELDGCRDGDDEELRADLAFDIGSEAVRLCNRWQYRGPVVDAGVMAEILMGTKPKETQ